MDQKEINNILIKNKKMIELIATNSYYEKFKKHIDKEDFIQEAFLITSKLLQRYDKKKGRLSTFLYANLSKELMRYAHSNLSLIYIPTHIYESVRKIRKYCTANNIDSDDITDDLVRQLTSDKSRSVDVIKRIIVDGSICKRFDFDSNLDLNDYYERYSNNDLKLDREILKRKLEGVLSFEKERDIKLITEYYNTDAKYIDLANKYNLPLGTISEIIKRVRTRMKKRLIKYKEELLND